ncbi:PilZ domain-containing protein [Mesorhizobium sp. ANAO-SY3R2]|uniref:PilZ domain-containing protein n=1 Tax=Mesorhizobium sp. ANAO-SY3R2 TaxID=3166644 RepID=UPI00366CF0D7
MTEDAPKNTPREHRNRVLKGASIITGVNNSEISCTIRNMHHNGAELRVPVDARIPERFLLYVPVDGIGYRAVVRWRKSDRVGVQFEGTAPKPAWHYG